MIQERRFSPWAPPAWSRSMCASSRQRTGTWAGCRIRTFPFRSLLPAQRVPHLHAAAEGAGQRHPPLADHFVEKFARRFKKNVKRISTPAIDSIAPITGRETSGSSKAASSARCSSPPATPSTASTCPVPADEGDHPGKKKQGQLSSLINTYERSLIVDALKDARETRARPPASSAPRRGSS